MRLQLDSTGIQGAHAAYGADGANARQSGVGQKPSGADSVGLTGVSRAVQADQASRSARLESLTSAVRAGTYSVSSAKLAQSLVSGAVVSGAGEK